MKTIVILGGGMSGLVANYVFRRHFRDVQVIVMEPGTPGLAFLAGGLKYLAKTPELEGMLDDLDVVTSEFSVSGGILLGDQVLPYPKCLRGMDTARSVRIQHDHYRKTRRCEPDAEFSKKAMNDPSDTDKKALRCDFVQAVDGLVAKAHIWKSSVVGVQPGEVTLRDGATVRYDFLVSTLPVWVMKRIAYFGAGLPDAMCAKLNLLRVDPRRDPYAKWDYVYTPYTPENIIHRFSPDGRGYTCEFNGDWDGSITTELHSELNFLFKEGWAAEACAKGLNGHLLPLQEPLVYPENVAAFGRFACWDPRATTEATYSQVISVGKGWGLAGA